MADQVKADWSAVVLSRSTPRAKPESYGVFHAMHAPAGLSEAKRYIPEDCVQQLLEELEGERDRLRASCDQGAWLTRTRSLADRLTKIIDQYKEGRGQ